jgi:uncharacterized protein (TIGR00255 family)
MLYSMTGFGKATGMVAGRSLMVEIRALNSKSADISLKVPLEMRSKETAIRGLLVAGLERGKFDVWINYADGEEGLSPFIHRGLIAAYHRSLSEIAKELGEPNQPLLPLICRIPEVFKPVESQFEETSWDALHAVILSAIEEVNTFRKREGMEMKQALEHHTASILAALAAISELEPARTERLREKLERNIRGSGIPSEWIDNNRLEQEFLYYLEKLDISEEKVRLAGHCRFFAETLSAEEAGGKKLNFISQEMGREINTLGSKASDMHIQHWVVKMKEELEKIKELLLNIL